MPRWTGSMEAPAANASGETRTAHSRLSVGFVLLQNFTLTPFATFIDVLRLAADEADLSRQIRCSWAVIGHPWRPVRSSCGVDIAPTEPFGDPRRFDYIVVVGGLLHRGPQADRETVAFIRQAAADGVTIVGLCTAVFLLIRAGIMNGYRCCVSWFHLQELMQEFPETTPIADQLFVVDRRRITCAGGTGALDVAATIVERHLGRAVAQKCLHILVVTEARPANAAQPHPPTPQRLRDGRVKRAILLMNQNISPPLSVTDIARRLGLTHRHLERLFDSELGVAPLKYYRLVRLRYGELQLKTTARTVSDIAHDCGFADASHFARSFRSAFGKTPLAVRAAALVEATA